MALLTVGSDRITLDGTQPHRRPLPLVESQSGQYLLGGREFVVVHLFGGPWWGAAVVDDQQRAPWVQGRGGAAQDREPVSPPTISARRVLGRPLQIRGFSA